jgi:hypothetical protein
MKPKNLKPEALRKTLVAGALEWERRYGVAPAITSAISEYDAARLVGHSPKSFGQDCVGRTAVTRGTDFCHNNVRYQVKANRPSGRGILLHWDCRRFTGGNLTQIRKKAVRNFSSGKFSSGDEVISRSSCRVFEGPA